LTPGFAWGSFLYYGFLNALDISVFYILMRYLQDIYEKNEGESPDRVLLSDKPLLGSVLIWVLLVIGVIYFIP